MSVTNLIPMAGAGSRFTAEGYTVPKPLIDVSGSPMIIQAAHSLPPADTWIFVCRKEHVEEFAIDDVLKDHFQNSQVITVDHLTEGQASTCLLAKPYVSMSDSLLIGACDNGMLWDEERYNNLVRDPAVDAIIWTFRNNITVTRNPHMYGWVETTNDNTALRVSCKNPVSDNPIDDHAIVGTFFFKKASYFFDAAERMIAKNRRINNEFYVDEVLNEVIEDGLNVKVFEVEKYICWGTPNDLRTYQYWERYFQKVL